MFALLTVFRCLPLVIRLLIILTTLRLLHGADPAPQDIHLVSDDRYRLDIAGPWWTTYITSQDSLESPPPEALVVPFGTNPVPIPDNHGHFEYADWMTFLSDHRNQHRNAIRLLGKPDVVESLPNGNYRLRWRSPKIIRMPTSTGTTDAKPSVLISPPGTFTWTFAPVEAVPTSSP